MTTIIVSTIAMVGGSLLIAPTASAHAVYPDTTAAHTTAARMASFDAQMVAYVNSARAAHGVQTLTVVGGLTSMSVWWSNQQLASHTLKHTSGGASIASSRYGVTAGLWGENVGRFPVSATAKQLFDAYMASPTHRANILNTRYNFIGMGTVSDSTQGYNTMEFAENVSGHQTAAEQAAAEKAAAQAAAEKAAAKAAAAKAAAAKKAAAEVAARNPAGNAQTTERDTNPVSYHYRPSRQAPVADTPPARPQAPAQAPARAAAPAVVHGVVSASFGALTVPDMGVEIRDASCTNVVIDTTTGADGLAEVTLSPGTYCAVATDAPAGVQTPDPVTFTVATSGEFTVSWDDLELAPTPPTQAPVSRSGFTMRPL